jgi:hypothetical protein
LSFVFANDLNASEEIQKSDSYTSPLYPEGEAFVRLKGLIESTFIPQTKKSNSYSYTSECIYSGWLCKNYKYTSLTEKSIKFIILDTYKWNEKFYETLFQTPSDYNESNAQNKSIENILISIPSGTKIFGDTYNIFWNTSSVFWSSDIGSDLMKSSFGIDYTENASSNSMLGAIEVKIKEIKRTKCQEENQNTGYDYNGDKCPWNGEISNQYLPTKEELMKETIYLNSSSIKIESIKDEFKYTIEVSSGSISDTGSSNTLYTLSYTKNSYTLEEAKAALEKKDIPSEKNPIFLSSGDNATDQLPCESLSNYRIRSECSAAKTNAYIVSTGIWAYYSDYEKYPASLDDIDNRSYFPKGIGDFKKNFSYAVEGSGYTSGYQIRYIGTIWEGSGSIAITDKKDYVALLSGATVPDIPKIFVHAPSDSMVLYIKNPQNLFALLNAKSNTSTRLSGIDVSDTIRNTMKSFFELKDISTLEKNLKNDVLLIVDNLDLTAPDVTMIISESDRDALAPSASARVVGSKDWYIYVSNSKASIDRYMNLSKEKSMSEAPDFRYVWTKKSALIQDAYMYVWDEFFEKMLTLETYITHYKKYRDVSRLGQLQESAWAYQDAYGTSPNTIEAVFEKMKVDPKVITNIGDLSIKDGLISDKNIGNLRTIKTLPEVDYDLSKITRVELEDYKVNILKYRDTWRASLDPMGIVMNRYGDGVEIDFFMTPIPELDGDMQSIRSLFEGIGKDSLSFLTNSKIRMGLLSFIVWVDPKKLLERMAANPELTMVLDEMNKNLLGDKNIFDYFAWEWAFSVGGIPADVLDGWNIEKIDAYISLQFMSEEKWKEFVDIVRKRLLGEFDNMPSGWYLDMKSFLAKPLIEDYEGRQIFYIEAIPVPFVGKIGFAYTFIDDFFFIGLNRTTIKRIIDVAKTGDIKKWEIIDSKTVPKGSFFLTLFDGKSASIDLKGLYEKNRTSISRYANLLDREIMSSSDPITSVVSAYYVSSLKTRKLGKGVTSLTYTLGWLSLIESGDTISVYLDEKIHRALSGTTVQIWKNLSTDERFPKKIWEKNGMPIEEFLKNPMKSEILSLELIIQLDRAFAGSESLLRNMTFSMNMADNEIGFTTRVFREKSSTSETWKSIFGSMKSSNNELFFIGGILLFLILLAFVGFFFWKNYKNNSWVSQTLSREAPFISPLQTDNSTKKNIGETASSSTEL